MLARAIPSQEPDVRQEQRRSAEGYSVNGLTYVDRVKPEVGTAYVLRSIRFDQSDITVALQAVRKDEDGSLVLAWRMLKQNPVPTFVP